MHSTAVRYSALFATFAVAAMLTGCQGLASAPAPPPNPQGTLQNSVNHIIFMAQENRGFDHMFGHLPQYFTQNGYPQTLDGTPVDAQNIGTDGNPVTPFHMISQCTENYSPFWNDGHLDFNYEDATSDTPLLDGFVRDAAHFSQDVGFTDILGRRVMGYFDSSDLPFYYFMAANFATSDRWFSPVMTRTQPNRMYMVAASSFGHVYPLPGGTLPNPTIFDELQAANISWRVYVTDDYNNPMYNGSLLSQFAVAAQYPQNFVSATQFVTDAQSGNLPAVAMIDPGYNTGRDEHPYDVPGEPGDGVQTGSNYVSSLINGLMQSQSWKDSVFVLTYDEAGGFFDHVPPQPTVSPDGIPPSDLQPADICYGNTSGSCDFTFTGYRIPLIVISPFTKKNYVSHTVADYTAILKLIETRYNLKNLSARDAAQFDMTEFFDFVNRPWLTPPASVPAQPTSETCSDQLPPP